MSLPVLTLPLAWNFVVPAFLGLMAGASYLAAYGILALAVVALAGALAALAGWWFGIPGLLRAGLALSGLAGLFAGRAGLARLARARRRRSGRMRLADLEESDRAWAGDEAVDLARLQDAGLPVRARELRRGDAPPAPAASGTRLRTRAPGADGARHAVFVEDEGRERRLDRLAHARAHPADAALLEWAARGERAVGAPLELALGEEAGAPIVEGCRRLEGAEASAVWIAAGAGADLAGDPVARLEQDLVEVSHGWARLLLAAGREVDVPRDAVRFVDGRPYLELGRLSLIPDPPPRIRAAAATLRLAVGAAPRGEVGGGSRPSPLDAVARMRSLVHDRLLPMARAARATELLVGAPGDAAARDRELAWVLEPELVEQRELDAALDALAEALAADRSVDLGALEDFGMLADPAPSDSPARSALRDFLERHGHRGPGERTLAGERWGDSPAALARAIAGSRRRVAPASLRRPGLERWPALALARRLVRVRLAHRRAAMRAQWRLRRDLERAGAAWVARGRLEEPGDLLHLTLDEWRSLESAPGGGSAELAGIAATRRREHLAAAERVPRTVLGATVATEGERLEGVPCGGGSAEGRVRHVGHPGDPLPEGDGWVLVLPDANPHFARQLGPSVRALVCERGGALCHLAVVSRELGIPAVMAALGSRELLREGAAVRVDGDRGTVLPLG